MHVYPHHRVHPSQQQVSREAAVRYQQVAAVRRRPLRPAGWRRLLPGALRG